MQRQNGCWRASWLSVLAAGRIVYDRMPVLGRREVGGRGAGGVVMAPQIGDGPPPQTTGKERILPVMR